MKTKRFLHYIYIGATASLLAFTSCNRHRADSTPADGDTIRMAYSELLTIVKHDGYKVAEIRNPWKQGKVLHRYVLVERADSARMASKTAGIKEATIVYTPIRRSVMFTSPHCWLLGQLGAEDVVKGVCDLSYIYVPYVQDGIKKGGITDCGNSMSPTVERIVALRPDAIFVSPFNGVSYGQMDHLGVPLIECADYMETSALGRAEWMRFYGMLVGKEEAADKMFADVVRSYDAIKKEAKRSKTSPKVITERVVSGVWYCPGGRSSMGRLIADAGGRYVFGDDKSSGSLPGVPEKVMSSAQDADCWFFVYNGMKAPDRKFLLDEYKGYAMIKAFKEGNVYECGSTTGIPYFEEISFRPDSLLLDFAKIFHPDIYHNAHTRYYKKME